MSYRLHQGDCLETLRGMADNSVDAIVTDPPYGLAFMGKKWDYDVPATEVWAECLRVLKPGGHLLAFAGTRTQHRMAVRIEDAGFEIRDMIAWVYGSGFPKSLDVSKALDKAAGRVGYATEEIKSVFRQAHSRSGRTLAQLNEVCGFEASGYLRSSSSWAFVLPPSDKWPAVRNALGLSSEMDALFERANREIVGFQKRGKSVNTGFMSGGNDITAPATEAARQWQGWGTALKPALEPITVARKPLGSTVAECVLAHGTGAINIDGCRVEGGERPLILGKPKDGNFSGEFREGSSHGGETALGRWPANLIHDGSPEVLAGFPEVKPHGKPAGTSTMGGVFGNSKAVGSLNQFTDTGSAARFFYTAKASSADRDEGLEGFEERSKKVSVIQTQGVGMHGQSEDGKQIAMARNHHPTVKPTDLMRYLVRLVTPPGGIVLDPFNGSGSTGKACMLEGFDYIGCELDPAYIEISRARIEHAIALRASGAEKLHPASARDDKTIDLFSGANE